MQLSPLLLQNKELPLFKKIITQENFGDHVDEVGSPQCPPVRLSAWRPRHPGPSPIVQITFPTTVCLTGVKVGAVPSATPQATKAFVHLFGKDLSCTSSGRFAQVADGFEQPEAGTKAVRFEVRTEQERSSLGGCCGCYFMPAACLKAT